MNRISGTNFRANAASIDNNGFDLARNRSFRGSLFALAGIMFRCLAPILLAATAMAQPEAPPKPASIEGKVANSARNEPLRKVDLTLSRNRGDIESTEAAMVLFAGDDTPAPPPARKIERKTLMATTDSNDLLPAQQPVVTVYLTNTNIPVFATLATAKSVVSQMYHLIGVDVRWKVGAPSAATGDTLQIEFLEEAPPRFASNAMAYATPYRSTGTCIHVFYNRVLHMRSRQFAPVLLGNVMAHEIAHVLEGVARHSDRGVMKASWDDCDYESMAHDAFSFALEDASLIKDHWRNQ